MLTHLEVFTSGVEIPPLSVVDQDESADFIQIIKIDGLGPVTGDVSTTSFTNLAGSDVTGTHEPDRNIVISLQLNPDWKTQTIESLRLILYRYFSTLSEVTLRFTSTHLPVVEIDGVVESINPNLFERDPVYQVSILCPKPDFVAVDSKTISGKTSDFRSSEAFEIDNPGVETGFVLDVKSTNDTVLEPFQFRVVNETDPYQLLIVKDVSLIEGEKTFRISTVDRMRYVRQVYTETVYDNILGSFDKSGTWVKLLKNKNRLRVLSSVGEFDWTLTYFLRFGGL